MVPFRPLSLVLAALSLLPGRAGAAPPDATDGLRFAPGLVITQPVVGGINSARELIGDYDYTATITAVERTSDPKHILENPGGLTVAYAFTAPVKSRGTRVVSAGDWRTARRLSLYWSNGESGPKFAYTSLVVSDVVFKELKKKKRSELYVDGPFPTRWLELDGEEPLPLLVDDQEVTVRALRAKADKHFTFWILDNPEMALVLKAEGPFKLVTTSLHYPRAVDQVVDDLEKSQEAVTHAILFDFNSATLKPESRPVLDSVGKYLASKPALALSVEGHTDAVGDSKYNLELSARRAESVKTYLVETHKLSPARITTAGRGAERPTATNETPEGRARNRRVVFRTRIATP